jgi:hypothetical protein
MMGTWETKKIAQRHQKITEKEFACSGLSPLGPQQQRWLALSRCYDRASSPAK